MNALAVVNESRLTRVWQHVSSTDTSCALISACSGEISAQKNLQRTVTLAGDVRGLGYGYFYFDGYWLEEAGTEQACQVKETALFVNGGEGSASLFVSNMLKLAAKSGHEGVLIKAAGRNAALYYVDGRPPAPCPSLQIGRMGDIYTQLRKSAIRRNAKLDTFVFEAERVEPCWAYKLGEQLIRTR